MEKENKFELIDKVRKEKKIKWVTIYEVLGMSKQGFSYHKKNLKENKISFSIEQIKIISDFLKIDKSVFF
jgi:hypothetical protein